VFLGVDRNQLRRKLKILQSLNFATVKTTNKYSVLTVINYDTYQPTKVEIDHQTDGQSTSNRPATDQQPTTPNNVKNVKNEKKVKKTKKNISPNGVKPPKSVEEVIEYFTSNGYTVESAETFFKYYANGEPPWHDGQGKPVRSWKSKAVAVWFKPENKHVEGKMPWHI
jgi:hypothetical protein